LVSLADGSGSTGSERRIEPKDPTQSLGFRSSGPSLDPGSRILE
jgi:hypothetical protein